MLKVISSALCVLGLIASSAEAHHEGILFSPHLDLRGNLHSPGGIGSDMWYQLLNIQHRRGNSQFYFCFMLAKFKVSISSDPSYKYYVDKCFFGVAFIFILVPVFISQYATGIVLQTCLRLFH